NAGFRLRVWLDGATRGSDGNLYRVRNLVANTLHISPGEARDAKWIQCRDLFDRQVVAVVLYDLQLRPVRNPAASKCWSLILCPCFENWSLILCRPKPLVEAFHRVYVHLAGRLGVCCGPGHHCSQDLMLLFGANFWGSGRRPRGRVLNPPWGIGLVRELGRPAITHLPDIIAEVMDLRCLRGQLVRRIGPSPCNI